MSEPKDLLARLIIENPELPVKYMVSDDINTYDHSYTEASIAKPYIDYYIKYGDRIYWFDEEEELMDDIIDNIACNYKYDETPSHEELEIMAKQIFKDSCRPWIKCIKVMIEPY